MERIAVSTDKVPGILPLVSCYGGDVYKRQWYRYNRPLGPALLSALPGAVWSGLWLPAVSGLPVQIGRAHV